MGCRVDSQEELLNTIAPDRSILRLVRGFLPLRLPFVAADVVSTARRLSSGSLDGW